MKKVTVLVGLQHGDEGKGKISYNLSKQNNYDCYVRFNGGPNAGHTIYVNDEPFVLHQIPCGIVNNVPCLISTCCVIDLKKLENEIQQLKKLNIDVDKLLNISYNCHVITEGNINEDVNSNKIGTTGSGIGPTYSKKALRTGTRICDIDSLPYNVVNPSLFLQKYENIFMEGAQGFELDIDNGDYPYVTSSPCIVGSIFLNGISPDVSPRVLGAAKLYDTYVGSKKFQPNDDIFKLLQKLGNEYGSMTGRSRQCNWLNINKLITSLNVNGVDELYINKCDIIKNLNKFYIIVNDSVIDFKTLDEMKQFIINEINKKCFKKISIVFSANPKTI